MAKNKTANKLLANSISMFVSEARSHVAAALAEALPGPPIADPHFGVRIEVIFSSNEAQPLSFKRFYSRGGTNLLSSVTGAVSSKSPNTQALLEAARSVESELRKVALLNHPHLRFAVQFPPQEMKEPVQFAFGLESWWELAPENMDAYDVALAVNEAVDEISKFCGFDQSVFEQPRTKLPIWDSQFDRSHKSVRAGSAREALAKQHIFALYRIGSQYTPKMRENGRGDTLREGARGLTYHVDSKIVEQGLLDLAHKTLDRKNHSNNTPTISDKIINNIIAMVKSAKIIVNEVGDAGERKKMTEDDAGILLAVRNHIITEPSDEVEKVFGLDIISSESALLPEDSHVIAARFANSVNQKNLSSEVSEEVTKIRHQFAELISLFNSLRVYSRPLNARIIFLKAPKSVLIPELSIGHGLFWGNGLGFTEMMKGISKDIRALEVSRTLADKNPGRHDEAIRKITGINSLKHTPIWNVRYEATSLEMALVQILGPKLHNAEFLKSAINDPASVAPDIFMSLIGSVSDEISELRDLKYPWSNR